MVQNGVTIVCNVVVPHEDVISVVLVVITGSHGITSTATSSQICIKGLQSPQLTSQTVGCHKGRCPAGDFEHGFHCTKSCQMDPLQEDCVAILCKKSECFAQIDFFL